ncbi:uncharacterized protein LOC129114763 isoform X1 [Anoplopoma fimbria]|uniref:uncharacterized protein LOC129114763 isoform X1 n=1 Tax=Anoplopoma fimbria TaxID=229290 RepID=UPI0023ED8969|nr:uncharacterized protein LOC129114763 isoform X1 [Anoplopoma fimbria]
MMAEFRWIKTSLFLILVLQFTAAATGQLPLSFTVRDGDEVTLPCNNVLEDHKNCNTTKWLFIDSRSPSVELVSLGKIGETAKAKSDRLSVSENCSLVLKNVTDEDVGRYDCRQFRSGQIQGPDAFVHLSVVTMTEHEDNDEVKLNCSVSTYGGCIHTVKWLYEGPDNTDITTSEAFCSASTSFPTSHFIYVSNNYTLLKCEVTEAIYPGEVKLFPYNPPQSSGSIPTTATLTTTPEGQDEPNTEPETDKVETQSPHNIQQNEEQCWSVLGYMMLVIRVAELLLMTVIVVLLIRAQGNRRPPDHNTVHGAGDGHEGTVNYENVGDPYVFVRLP